MTERTDDDGATERALARARAGSEHAFRTLTDPYRRELQLHLYRIVGSVDDAEDLLQETLLSAWRGLGGFEERASVRAWLYRIATNRALDFLRAKRRRPERLPRLQGAPQPTAMLEAIWLEPYPDLLLEGVPDAAPGPDARYEMREAVALAFVAGLQQLPPQQRAALVLRDVLGFRASEVAEIVGTTETAVHSALRRARSAFETRRAGGGRERATLPADRAGRDLLGRFADAVEAGDVDGMVTLLAADAWLTMPPESHAYQGHAAITGFLAGREVSRATLRLVPTRANGQPAFAVYRQAGPQEARVPYSVFVLTFDGAELVAITWFANPSAVARFEATSNGATP